MVRVSDNIRPRRVSLVMNISLLAHHGSQSLSLATRSIHYTTKRILASSIFMTISPAKLGICVGNGPPSFRQSFSQAMDLRENFLLRTASEGHYSLDTKILSFGCIFAGCPELIGNERFESFYLTSNVEGNNEVDGRCCSSGRARVRLGWAASVECAGGCLRE
jgi:hypothetical protein